VTFFWENAEILSERLKKVVQKFRLKFGPPGSEVLDPLVLQHQVVTRESVILLTIVVREGLQKGEGVC